MMSFQKSNGLTRRIVELSELLTAGRYKPECAGVMRMRELICSQGLKLALVCDCDVVSSMDQGATIR